MSTLKMAKLRRYTITDIDEMRSSLYQIEGAQERHPLEGCWTVSSSQEAYEKNQSARIEDQLRTCMIGGVGPEELKEKAEAAKAAQLAWYAQERKRLEERRLRDEYGPRS